MTAIELDALRSQLVLHEGDEPFPYDDATGKALKPGDTLKGHLTVGVGYNLTALPLSTRVRALMLDERIDECLTDLRSFPWFISLDAIRQRAVADLRFNLGPTRFRTFKQLIAAMGREDYARATRELVTSKWSTQVQPSRVMRLVRMLKTGLE